MSRMESRRNEFLADVAAHAADIVKDFNLPDDIAEQIGAAVADNMADNWGGQVLTFPKNYAYKLAQRDRRILEAFRKDPNYATIARANGMTERGVRKLLRRAESRDRDLRQQQLFDIEAKQ